MRLHTDQTRTRGRSVSDNGRETLDDFFLSKTFSRNVMKIIVFTTLVGFSAEEDFFQVAAG